MSRKHQVHPTRLLAFLLAGPLFLAVLVFLAWLHFKVDTGGFAGFISDAFKIKPIRQFGLRYGLTILVPIYLGAGVLAWLVSMLPAALARPGLLKDWRAGEALGLASSVLLWAHAVLWWQVPTALWVIPGLRRLPFFLLFPLLALLAWAYPCHWLGRCQGRRAGPAGRGPGRLAPAVDRAGPGAPVAAQAEARRQGRRPALPGAHAGHRRAALGHLPGPRRGPGRHPLPERLHPHPRHPPALAHPLGRRHHELHHRPRGAQRGGAQGAHDLALLRQASLKGWRPRFYIDDGGTIGLAGRRMDLDDALMPATGWENFVNSNLAVNFPFYAVMENLLKPFPTTNPWAPLDAGLKEALRLGRGSGWVMFHSCLAHQPIFLNREELAGGPVVDALPPGLPAQVRPRPGQARGDGAPGPPHQHLPGLPDPPGRHPGAWKPIWNGLAQDPAYQDAVRVLFSDHGERFHHVGNGFQLQGVHGFNLDPWECRATLLVAGPGFTQGEDPTPRDATISLLGLRAGVSRLLDGTALRRRLPGVLHAQGAVPLPHPGHRRLRRGAVRIPGRTGEGPGGEHLPGPRRAVVDPLHEERHGAGHAPNLVS